MTILTKGVDMKQKYPAYSFVHVCKEMPPYMKHFHCDFDAIVGYTYSQKYGGKNIKSYSLYQIANGKVVNSIAWYDESQLTMLENQSKEKAEEMIEQYNLGSS
jgi:hypothetical protein